MEFIRLLCLHGWAKMSSIKKITDWLLLNPAVVLAIFYMYWLISIPTGLIVWGFLLLGTYVLIVILEKLASGNESFLLIALLLALLAAVPATVYAVLAISLLADYGAENITSKVVFLSGAAVIVVSTYKKFTAKSNPFQRIIFVCAFPLMLLNILFFSLFYPTVRDTAFFQGNRYHIVNETNDDFHSYQAFYKCTLFGFYCKRLYGSIGYGDAKIIVDNRQNEISLFEKSGLSYTYGNQVRYYVGYPLKANDQIYELGWHCNQASPLDCDKVDYFLYQCNLDYTECKPLPVKYTSYSEDNSLELEEIAETGEILLFDNFDESPTLIFSYGEQPRCYVEDCQILEK